MKVNILVAIMVVGALMILLMDQSSAFGQQNNLNNITGENRISGKSHSQTDTTRPSVNITNPPYPPTVTTGKIIINGTASDSGSGILNVSAAIHVFPFTGDFPVPPGSQPMPVSPKNWSKWSFPLVINKTDTYRVVIQARDNAGNLNYAETTINAALEKKNTTSDLETKKVTPRIAFVRPTFTEAAYQENGFFNFYFKYGFPPVGKNITTDLDMLTVKTPRSVSEFQSNDVYHQTNITSLVPVNGTELHDISQGTFPNPQKFWLPFIDHVKEDARNAMVTVMRDEDVHDGHIFYPDNKTNAYDVLFLFHNEYVTQNEYDNLRQFVKNGGTIVFIDANMFYAEVSYNRDNNTITLVKGHDWQYDGKSAKRSVPERWYNETKNWVGENFLATDFNENITFANNPFNYTHFEENFINNPKAKVLIDYDIKFPKYFVDLYLKKVRLPTKLHRGGIPIESIRVATYELDYGKGKIIALGLTGQNLADNQDFMKFFDNVILPKSLCPKFQPCWYSPMTHYIYGCTEYQHFGIHCDPISNRFESYEVPANFTKISSATREPSYVQSKYGKGVHLSGAHALESLRANIIHSYNTKQFSIFLSIMPDKYDKDIGNPYMILASYKNGIFKGSNETAGWIIELVPNNNPSLKKVRFTVFNTRGVPTSSEDIDIPAGMFSQIFGTFDGKNVRIYINGILRSITPFVGVYSGGVDSKNFLKIGGDAYCSCYLASAIFDEVKYYNYSLGSGAILQIKNSSDDVSEKGLVGYWKFDGDLKDYSHYKNDMFYNTLISSMAFAPDGRLFYAEKNSGNIRIMLNNTVLDRPFASIPKVHVNFEQGLLGLAIDSKFKENHFIYVYYNYKDKDNGNIYARIVRFTAQDNKGINQKIIIDKIPASAAGYHTGGALTFNKADDKLYATVGDSINNTNAQNVSSLNGKTLRLNRDGSIPNDNPFPNSPVYTYGHRNMYGIAFDNNGHGLVTEPGSALYDEINSNLKGGNYGWSTMQPANTPPNPLVNDTSVKPMRSYYIVQNPTQAVYYNGDIFPELNDSFIVGTFRGDLFAYKISDDGKKLLNEINIRTSSYPSSEVVATALSPSGEIYFAAYDIFKMEKIDFKSKIQTMYLVQINASGLNVSNLNYSKSTKEITFDLSNVQKDSSFSVLIPNLLTETSSEENVCDFHKGEFTNEPFNSEFPYDTVILKYDNFDIMKVQFTDKTPDNLKFRVNSHIIDCLSSQNM